MTTNLAMSQRQQCKEIEESIKQDCMECVPANLRKRFILDVGFDINSNILFFEAIFVPELLRKKGYGSQIIRNLIEVSKKLNICKIQLHAFPFYYDERDVRGNKYYEVKKQIEYYEKFGFKCSTLKELREIYENDNIELVFSELNSTSLMELSLT